MVRAVDGVDLDIDAGETVAVMGPSGCGKSTLLHLLGGLDRPSGGEVSLNGRRIDDSGEKALARMRRTAVGFVFQAFHLMAAHRRGERRAVGAAGRTLAAGGQTACGEAAGAGRARRPGAVPALGAVRRPAAARRDRPGVEQRTVGRPRRRTPGNLDSAATLGVLRLFESLHESGQTLVIVTHDARIAATADRMISMRDGAFVDETRLSGGATGQLGALVGLED
jgi:putative ABC transport system ATP-binding protein